MEPKHYKKCLRKLKDAGYSYEKISDKCYISVPTIRDILTKDLIPTERIKKMIVK